MFSTCFGFDAGIENILEAVKGIADYLCFDPLLEMLDEAEAAWDGIKRLDTWVIKYLGCKDTPL
ncbi:MAG TPA: hypothetical protein VEJ37_05025 [Xanthobacteraceae bacterium]|nr:hypothetical protein [Xanthobacteraceae bacterium]